MLSVVIGEYLEEQLLNHLLQHTKKDIRQEEILLGMYVESSGEHRRTAILSEIIWPLDGDTQDTCQGATANPQYLTRAVRQCQSEGKGLFIIHNHLTPGWQTLSWTDYRTEQERVANLTRITRMPLIGLTVGTDGTFSARWWMRPQGNRRPAKLRWCDTVRITGSRGLQVYHAPKHGAQKRLGKKYQRRLETWGVETQLSLAKLRVGIVGAGSVGMLLAEALGRIGIEKLTIIDPDCVEEQNLDRLVGSDTSWIGQYKADIAANVAARAFGEGENNIRGYPVSVESERGWKVALDCDLLFVSVDSAIARDVTNHIAIGHGVPVIEGGVRVERNAKDRLARAHYVSAWITAETACMRCIGQYNTGDIGTERKGQRIPGYVFGKADFSTQGSGGNVFVFAMGCAQQQLEMFIRNVVGEAWWKHPWFVRRQITTGSQLLGEPICAEGCAMRTKRFGGNGVKPPYFESSMGVGILGKKG